MTEAQRDRAARIHRRVSLVRRGGETYETPTITTRGPYTLRCVVCDKPSEKAVCCV